MSHLSIKTSKQHLSLKFSSKWFLFRDVMGYVLIPSSYFIIWFQAAIELLLLGSFKIALQSILAND